MGDETGIDANLHELARIRVEFARRVARAIRQVDVSGMETWGMVVESALGAGVEERDLIERVSCSLSTVHRWRSGQFAPLPELRVVIRNMLSDMLGAWADDMERRLDGIGPAEATQAALPGFEDGTSVPVP